ncbi:MAG TPA: fatty acid desaturase [Terracidiphilus sp.]|jgi:fatty-acid desaturase|nr:fatty acid desaturase [Terracidiphilus sp.]
MMQTVISGPGELVLCSNAELKQSNSNEFNWVFFVVIATFHMGALAAFFFFRLSSFALFLVMWLLSQNVGIAVSYHRQLTHRGFTTPKWLEHAMALCGALALQGSPTYWVAVHRMHHRYTDRPGDPHSPRDGKWWSHMGWIMRGALHNETAMIVRYAPDLQRDRFYRWLAVWHWLPITLTGIVLLGTGSAVGGWKLGLSWLLWGVLLRISVGFHVTWLVNSATHLWGSRRFNTQDDSTNNWWVALLTGGEGWHNNHHAHPVSANHGMARWEVDFNYWIIRMLGLLGLAKDIKLMRTRMARHASQNLSILS